MKQTTTIIVGASIAGLASAACLQKRGIDYIIIEKESQSFLPWRNHYQRLHLHTNKNLSNLPYKKFGKKIPRYPSRQQVVDYLEDYQATFNIHPIYNTAARSISRQSNEWIVETGNGTFRSKYIIISTGRYGKPKAIGFTGMETFPGKILHSYHYNTGADFTGQKVLVVGFGNSACEIAIDLYEQGADPYMSIRSPINIVPRDLLGIPILRISVLLSKLPPRMADVINAPILSLLYGDITKLGIQKMPYGVFEQIQKDGDAPVLDIGTIKLIRQGKIKTCNGIDYINGAKVHFTGGATEVFDSIVAAIGYDDNNDIIHAAENRFEDLKVSIDKQKWFGKDSLYFCGFWVSPTGQIREIASDAVKIAKDIAAKENKNVV